MKFLAITLIVHAPDPITGVQKSTTGRFREVIGNALLAEELGFDGWDRNAESYEIFRQIWRKPTVTATPRFRPPLRDAEIWPRPLQQPIRIWDGSATSKESVDLAARYGDPLFSANVTNPIEPYAELVRYYRQRWAHYGHDRAGLVVGAGTAGYYAARNSRDALAVYGPIFTAQRAFQQRLGLRPVFTDLDDFVARSSALIGSPQLRREIPDPPWPGETVADPALAGSAT